MSYQLKHTTWVGVDGQGRISQISPKLLTPSEALELAAYLVVLAEIAVAGRPEDESLPLFEDVLEAVRNT